MNKINNIIFSDLDGTLLDHYTYQSTAASKTLQQLKHANIPRYFKYQQNISRNRNN